MNFNETPAGQMFFEHQLPQLIKALQSISDSLNRKSPAVKLPLTEIPDILKELYLGNYEASVFHDTAPSAALNNTVLIKQQVLMSSLSKNSLALFDDYCEAAVRRNNAIAEQAYRSGFCTATQLIIAGLSEPPGKEADYEDS